jgi:hypothetical protein
MQKRGFAGLYSSEHYPGKRPFEHETGLLRLKAGRLESYVNMQDSNNSKDRKDNRAARLQ